MKIKLFSHYLLYRSDFPCWETGYSKLAVRIPRTVFFFEQNWFWRAPLKLCTIRHFQCMQLFRTTKCTRYGAILVTGQLVRLLWAIFFSNMTSNQSSRFQSVANPSIKCWQSVSTNNSIRIIEKNDGYKKYLLETLSWMRVALGISAEHNI